MKEGALTAGNCIPLLSGLFDLMAEAHERIKLPGSASFARASRMRMRLPSGHHAMPVLPTDDPVHRWNSLQQERIDAAKREWQGLKSRLESAAAASSPSGQVITDAFKALWRCNYLLRVDMANMKIRRIVPVIQDHGITYEKTQFQKHLDSGSRTLEATRLWLAHHRRQRQAPDGCSVQFVASAIVDLVVQYPHWGGVQRSRADFDKIPETLLLDLLRIKALNAHFHTDVMCIVATLTVASWSSEQQQLMAIPPGAAGRVAAILRESPPKPLNPAESLRNVRAKLVEEEEGVSEEAAAAACELIAKHLRRSHAVYAAMVSTGGAKLCFALLHRLTCAYVCAQVKVLQKYWTSVLVEGLRNTSEEPAVPVPPSIPEAARTLLHDSKVHAMELVPVANVNIKVHAERYREIMLAMDNNNNV